MDLADVEIADLKRTREILIDRRRRASLWVRGLDTYFDWGFRRIARVFQITGICIGFLGKILYFGLRLLAWTFRLFLIAFGHRKAFDGHLMTRWEQARMMVPVWLSVAALGVLLWQGGKPEI